MHVETISTIGSEEKFFEILSELTLCNCAQQSNLGLLTIKLVLVSGDLTLPEAIELFIRALVFFGNDGMD